MQPARDHPLFLCGFWMCISIVYWNKSVPKFFWGGGLTFDLQRSLEVKNIFPIWKPMHDFLSNFYWHFLSILYRFWDIRLQSFQGLTLTFRGHLRSKIFSPFESPYMTSYLTSIDTFSLFHTVFEIWLQSFQGLTLTFRGHLRSKIFSPFESPYMTYYLVSFDTFSLSPTVFEIFDFKSWFWMCMPIAQQHRDVEATLLNCGIGGFTVTWNFGCCNTSPIRRFMVR